VFVERLHKYIARCGAASRRKAEGLIAAGQIRVNGETVVHMGALIDPDTDRVDYRGQILRPIQKKYYYMLNKPKGVLTTLSDPHGRPTIQSYIPKNLGLFPVGRLDFMTQGLLLLTNDGELANRLIHPRYKVEKTYRVTVWGKVGPKKIHALQTGILLEEGVWTLPAKVRYISGDQRQTTLEMMIKEGKKRQIRRMCLSLGHPVTELTRISVGPVRLSDLPAAAMRALRDEEIFMLKKQCNLL
jgi:pseudouridine synthase